jgi:hypothetical protein
MAELKTLATGLVFGEQPRWHDGRLWFSDWGTQDVMAADLAGSTEVMVHAGSFPCCSGWLPAAHRVRHCRRWRLVEPPRVGRSRRRSPRRHLPRCGRRCLVRGRSQQAVRARRGGWRGVADGGSRPRLLCVRARWCLADHAVHDGNRMERPCGDVQRAAHGPGCGAGRHRGRSWVALGLAGQQTDGGRGLMTRAGATAGRSR